jgi:hypothetical protein
VLPVTPVSKQLSGKSGRGGALSTGGIKKRVTFGNDQAKGIHDAYIHKHKSTTALCDRTSITQCSIHQVYSMFTTAVC